MVGREGSQGCRRACQVQGQVCWSRVGSWESDSQKNMSAGDRDEERRTKRDRRYL